MRRQVHIVEHAEIKRSAFGVTGLPVVASNVSDSAPECENSVICPIAVKTLAIVHFMTVPFTFSFATFAAPQELFDANRSIDFFMADSIADFARFIARSLL